MGLSFRKSAKVGPFRFNFSKSGISVSAGVKGARVRYGSKGTYVTFGANGLYYKKRITEVSDDNSIPNHNEQVILSTQHTITTKNFDDLTDADSSDFIKELEEKINKISYFKYFGWIPSLIIVLLLPGILNSPINRIKEYKNVVEITSDKVNIRDNPTKTGKVLFLAERTSTFTLLDSLINPEKNKWYKVTLDSSGTHGYVMSSLVTTKNVPIKDQTIRRFDGRQWLLWIILIPIYIGLLAWCIRMYLLDKKRKTINLEYELDQNIQELHNRFLEYFKEFKNVKRKWQIIHSQAAGDSKYHAGASTLVNRNNISKIDENRLPLSFLNTNVEIPYIGLGSIKNFVFL
jgi:Protein of unknown function (DUF4236)